MSAAAEHVVMDRYLTRAHKQLIRSRMKAAVESALKELDMLDDMQFSLTAVMSDEDEVIFEAAIKSTASEAREFATLCHEFCLTPQDYMKAVTWNGTKYYVCGFDVTSRKVPIYVVTAKGSVPVKRPVGIIRKLVDSSKLGLFNSLYGYK